MERGDLTTELFRREFTKLNELKMPQPWIAFSGGPGAGKTTMVDALRPYFAVSSEVAREVRMEMVAASAGAPTPWFQDPLSLNLEILRRKIHRESTLDSSVPTLFDRGIPDSFVYLELHGVHLCPADFPGLFRRYAGALIFDRFELRDDKIHDSRDRDFAEFIEKRTRSIYEELGCRPIQVPRLVHRERFEFVRAQLTKLFKKTT